MTSATRQSAEYDPLEIIRYYDGARFFGFKPSMLKEKIDAGAIPAPIPLSDGGRAMGWTRQMIADHHAEMIALAEERKQAEGAKVTQPQPAALAKVRRVKKVKLGRPHAKASGPHP